MSPVVILPSKKPLIALAVAEGLLIALLVLMVLQTEIKLLTVVVPVVLLSSIPYTVLAMRAAGNRLTLGEHQISHRTGLLAKQERAFDLSKIQDVRSEQSLWQRMLGTGTLIVQTASHDGGIRMEGIDAPQDVVKQILDAQRRAK